MTGAIDALLTAGAIWGIVYILFQEPLAGLIPLSYSIVSLLSVVHFGLTRQYRFFRSSQLVLILFLPFLLMLALGGFINSSAVILWSFICPLGALLFAEPRQAPRWLVAYIVLLTLSGFLQPYVRLTNHLSQDLVIAFFVLNIAAVSSIVFVLLHCFVGQKDLAYRLLRVEQDRSEGLLLNVLPQEIASRLKGGERTIADQHPSVSILFADLVGFTPLTNVLSPGEMVELLNHAHALAHLALEMNSYISGLAPVGGQRLSFRIGINSGPVIAGVIGRKKFSYDVWGDTVNTASRMESQGVPGKIQITQTTYELLKNDFLCETNGPVFVKGKGQMETWSLNGLRSDPRNHPPNPIR